MMIVKKLSRIGRMVLEKITIYKKTAIGSVVFMVVVALVYGIGRGYAEGIGADIWRSTGGRIFGTSPEPKPQAQIPTQTTTASSSGQLAIQIHNSPVNIGGYQGIIGDNNRNNTVIQITNNYNDNQTLAGFSEYLRMEEELKKLEKTLSAIPKDQIEARLNVGQMIEKKKKEMETFRQEVLRLAETFTTIPLNTERLKKAKILFGAGRIKEANAVLNEKELCDDQTRLLAAQATADRKTEALRRARANNANEFLVKAQVTALDFGQPDRFGQACEFYEQAIRSDATFDIFMVYADFLEKHNQFSKAQQFYRRAMTTIDSKEKEVEEKRARVLNNLGNVQGKQNDFSAATSSLTKALRIHRKLAKDNPQAHMPDVATTLNNLGVVQRNRNDFQAATASYIEALAVRRKLAKANSKVYLPYVATTLNNLGAVQSYRKDFPAAAASFSEALAIYRNLAKADPQAYLPYMAIMLNNLGTVEAHLKDFPAAMMSLSEALAIRRNLTKADPKAYLSNVAETLNNLGLVQSELNDFLSAKANYTEALEIRRKLAKSDPQAYLPDVAMTAINLSIFYLQSLPDREKSEALAREAIGIVSPLVETVPYTQEYLQKAKAVLKGWKIRYIQNIIYYFLVPCSLVFLLICFFRYVFVKKRVSKANPMG